MIEKLFWGLDVGRNLLPCIVAIKKPYVYSYICRNCSGLTNMGDQTVRRKAPDIRADNEGKGTKQITDKPFSSPGLRDVRTTGVFRVVNFELFVKPVSGKSTLFLCHTKCY